MAKKAPICIKAWGNFACFTRPEAKVERYSYEVITPSAVRGILEAIYWKPQIRWIVERLHVLHAIQFTNLHRNEVSSKISRSLATKAMNGNASEPLSLFIEDERQQRGATILRDVAYIIEARFDLIDCSDTVAKHYNMFKRRASQGQYFQHPYLGTREFICDFEWVDGDIPASKIHGEVDLGYILHDIDFAQGRTPRFFHATMQDGIIEVPPLAELENRS